MKKILFSFLLFLCGVTPVFASVPSPPQTPAQAGYEHYFMFPINDVSEPEMWAVVYYNGTNPVLSSGSGCDGNAYCIVMPDSNNAGYLIDGSGGIIASIFPWNTPEFGIYQYIYDAPSSFIHYSSSNSSGSGGSNGGFSLSLDLISSFFSHITSSLSIIFLIFTTLLGFSYIFKIIKRSLAFENSVEYRRAKSIAGHTDAILRRLHKN